MTKGFEQRFVTTIYKGKAMSAASAEALLRELEQCIDSPRLPEDPKERLFVGVDLGTAFVVVVVLDEQKKPLACAMEFAHVVRDGLVVDYAGAVDVVRRLVAKVEGQLHCKLQNAAIAVPPGTDARTCTTHRYVVEAAGLEVTGTLDEPTAANAVLGISNGVIVDIGGGTTGLSIFKDGKVIYTADEATGGTHVSLVISGNRGIPVADAEKLKRDTSKHGEILPIVRPVIEKMAFIVKKHIDAFDVDTIHVVGGTCCLTGMEHIVAKETGKKVIKPYNPLLITPLGIALNCYDSDMTLEGC